MCQDQTVGCGAEGCGANFFVSLHPKSQFEGEFNEVLRDRFVETYVKFIPRYGSILAIFLGKKATKSDA